MSYGKAMFRPNVLRRMKSKRLVAEKIGFERAVAFPQHTLQSHLEWKSRIMTAKAHV
jgi:hypothetical protein